MFNKSITIKVENIKMDAGLNDSETAQKIWEALPIEGNVNTWGDEIESLLSKKRGKVVNIKHG